MAYSNYVAMVIVCNSDSLKVLQRIKNQIHSLKSVLEKHGSLKVGSGKVPISILKSSDPRAVPHIAVVIMNLASQQYPRQSGTCLHCWVLQYHVHYIVDGNT